MRLDQSLEPQPRGVDGAFGSGVNEYIVEEPPKGAPKERGNHRNCHGTVISLSSANTQPFIPGLNTFLDQGSVPFRKKPSRLDLLQK